MSRGQARDFQSWFLDSIHSIRSLSLASLTKPQIHPTATIHTKLLQLLVVQHS
jgi:hypothetical protein